MKTHSHTEKNLAKRGKIGVSATLTALLVLTACGSADDTGSEPQTEDIEPTDNQLVEDSSSLEGKSLEPRSDGYTMQVRYYWIPDESDTQPTEARFFMRAPTDENSYVTEVMSYDVMPSIYAEDYYQHTFFMQDSDSVSATGYTHNPPGDGTVACLMIETEQEVVVDYQESEPGDDSVSCYGYAPDVEYEYDPGTPPSDFPVPF